MSLKCEPKSLVCRTYDMQSASACDPLESTLTVPAYLMSPGCIDPFQRSWTRPDCRDSSWHRGLHSILEFGYLQTSSVERTSVPHTKKAGKRVFHRQCSKSELHHSLRTNIVVRSERSAQKQLGCKSTQGDKDYVIIKRGNL